VWTWADDQTVGFVRRRQAHEALIHRIDAELAAGEVTAVDPDLAADGVDEVLRVMAGGVPDWATFEPEGTEVRLHAVDVGRTWGAALGRMRGTSPTSGVTYDEGAMSVGLDAVNPHAEISGSAANLDRWLWGRGDLAALAIQGEAGVAERVRSVVAESTQ
jgi:hypothetical protein